MPYQFILSSIKKAFTEHFYDTFNIGSVCIIIVISVILFRYKIFRFIMVVLEQQLPVLKLQ